MSRWLNRPCFHRRWGYEVILPPPTIAYLASVNSIAGTAFTFLQALAAGGGVPELVPVRQVRWIVLRDVQRKLMTPCRAAPRRSSSDTCQCTLTWSGRPFSSRTRAEVSFSPRHG